MNRDEVATAVTQGVFRDGRARPTCGRAADLRRQRCCSRRSRRSTSTRAKATLEDAGLAEVPTALGRRTASRWAFNLGYSTATPVPRPPRSSLPPRSRRSAPSSRSPARAGRLPAARVRHLVTRRCSSSSSATRSRRPCRSAGGSPFPPDGTNADTSTTPTTRQRSRRPAARPPRTPANSGTPHPRGPLHPRGHDPAFEVADQLRVFNGAEMFTLGGRPMRRPSGCSRTSRNPRQGLGIHGCRAPPTTRESIMETTRARTLPPWVRALPGSSCAFVISLFAVLTLTFLMIQLIPGDPCGSPSDRMRPQASSRSGACCSASTSRSGSSTSTGTGAHAPRQPSASICSLSSRCRSSCRSRIGNTAIIVTVALLGTMLLAVLGGLLFGIWTHRGRRPGLRFPGSTSTGTLSAIPDFLFAVGLVFLFAVTLRDLPGSRPAAGSDLLRAPDAQRSPSAPPPS